MEKKVKSISDFLSEEDILLLTEEAFTSHKIIKLEFKKVKPFMTIAASLILVVGILNIDSISAKTAELFSYVFGIGMSKNSDLNDYYILENPIQLTDELQIEGAYRKGNDLTMVLRGPVYNQDMKLKIGNTIYEPVVGESIARNTTVSQSEQSTEQLEQTEVKFQSIKQQNDLTFMLNGEEFNFTLKQPAVIGSNALISIPVEDSVLQLLPLNSSHTKFVISYEVPLVGNVPWVPKTLGLFSDEFGEQSFSTNNSMNPHEIYTADSLSGLIKRFDGTGISLTKEFKGLFNVPELNLPNPTSGETILIDEEFDIDGVIVTVHSISREGEEVTILFNRETSFKPLDLIWLECNGGGAGGGGDEQTVNMILNTVPSDSKALTFKVETLRVIIEEPFEIIF